MLTLSKEVSNKTLLRYYRKWLNHLIYKVEKVENKLDSIEKRVKELEKRIGNNDETDK